jgi:hypothetical protein
MNPAPPRRLIRAFLAFGDITYPPALINPVFYHEKLSANIRNIKHLT